VHAPFDAKKALIEKHRARVDPTDPQRSPTYAAMVESLDDAVGTLVDALDRLGLAGRTAIIFFSDNGGNMYNEVDGTTPTSNAPLRGGKATMFEGGVRVPAIVQWPGVTRAGTRSDAMIQSTDFYPTLLNLLNLHPTADHPLDGLDITAALRGKAFKRGPMFTYFPHQTRVPDYLPPSGSVHVGVWKLIRLFHQCDGGAHTWNLYNLRDDEGERTNLASREPERVKAMDALMENFLIDTEAVLPQPNPAYRPDNDANPQSGSRDWTGSKDTTISIESGELVIQSSGRDPWFATRAIPKGQGPFTLQLRMRSTASGKALVYYCNTPKRGFNREQTVPLPVKHDGEWHEYKVIVPSEKLTALRIDPATAKGEVRLSSLTLTDAAGKMVKRWNLAPR